MCGYQNQILLGFIFGVERADVQIRLVSVWGLWVYQGGITRGSAGFREALGGPAGGVYYAYGNQSEEFRLARNVKDETRIRQQKY